MAEKPKKFTVVTFKKLPVEQMNATQCVPTSWIKCYVDDVQVAVAYPTDKEMTSTNKSLMRNGKDPIQKWDVFPATIERQLDTYKEWQAEPSPAAKTPQLPQMILNLHISDPSTPKGPGKPKNLQNLFNTPDTTIDETQSTSNTGIRVDEQHLRELYQTWKQMNAIMEKIFNNENKS